VTARSLWRPELRRPLSEPHVYGSHLWRESRQVWRPEKDYPEKENCVTGKFENYNGKPEIIVTEPQQIKVASK
jgi:hypothetical protein